MNNKSRLEFEYVGPLAEEIIEFIRHKRMLGLKYISEARVIQHFILILYRGMASNYFIFIFFIWV